jgi:hypothetical protein
LPICCIHAYFGMDNLPTTRSLSKIIPLLTVLQAMEVCNKAVSVRVHVTARSWNCCCPGNSINITCSQCVSVALVIQNTKRVRSVILPSVAPPALPYFPILSHIRQDFREKVTDYETRVLIFSKAFAWNLYYLRKNRARYDR